MNNEAESKKVIGKLLGSRIICTLSDGRTAEGNFICIDRLCNLILADCIERRMIKASDYNEFCQPDDPPVAKQVVRHLRQAMVPGANLVKVEMDQELFEEKLNATIEK